MMSSIRAVHYRDRLLEVIDAYIYEEKQNNEKSAGVQRARALKSTIEWQLLGVEKLTDRQLIWRMLDYAAMEHGTGPLQTSSKLRLRILKDLCQSMSIADITVKNECDLVRCHELKILMSSPIPPGIFYFENTSDISKTAMVGLITKQLKKIYSYDDKLATELVQQLSDAINQYIEEESTHYFGDADCTQARRVQETIRAQWVMHENLNEQQMLWRLHEQLSLQGAGMFGGNTKLRSTVAKVLCRFLNCDEKEMAADVNLRTGSSHFRHTWFGPVFIPAMDNSIYSDVRCRHIAARLIERSPKMAHPHEMKSFGSYG